MSLGGLAVMGLRNHFKTVFMMTMKTRQKPTPRTVAPMPMMTSEMTAASREAIAR
jgi:hypothetical protein